MQPFSHCSRTRNVSFLSLYLQASSSAPLTYRDSLSMRSFFKKPAWANADEEPSETEFYRRSQQTYNDIVKARRQQQHEEAARLSVNSSTEPGIPATTAPSKRRRLSDSDKNSDSDEQATGTIALEQEKVAVSDVTDQRAESISPERGLTPVDTQEPISPDVQVVEDSQSSKKHSSSPDLPSDELTQAQDSVTNTVQDVHTRRNRYIETTDKQEDITVEILITSAIANTKPLVVHRRMSQRLRDVRLAWCERQGFDKKMTSSVYLTWNKRRLFDVTTCRSLDLTNSLELDDEIFSTPSSVRIHVEAVTDDLLRLQAEQLARDNATDEYKYETQEDQPSFHIVLKSQDRGDLRVKVLPQTTISQVIANFRGKRKISPESSVALSFDGDVLDPQCQLKDYDIADLDLVDVFLR